jgi:hypothetical protein
MHHPRWFIYGIVDGLFVGLAAGGLLLLPMGLSEATAGYVEHAGMAPVAYFLFGGACGGFFGLLVGAVGGIAIDLLRQFGLTDRSAVWIVMGPVLAGAVVMWWQFLLAPAVAVIVDLIWRLRRLDRRAPTVLT